LSAERAKEELVGKAPLSPAASLPSPWPIRSWFWFQRLPWRSLSTLALEAVSRKLTSVMISVGSSSWFRVDSSGSAGK